MEQDISILDNSIESVVELLVEGKIVALFTGRLEYGPRALGNRSIVCRPDDRTLTTRLSKDLERPYFMPFAPSVLARLADRCFLRMNGAKKTARYMNISFQATPWFKNVAPSVVHVDDSVRPALVDDTNPMFLEILEKFYERTGIPGILNTSFYRHGEPIVCSPEDALKTFLASDIDYLAIGSFLIKNPHVSAAKTESTSIKTYH